ncbi:MAG: cytochrome c oxidase subunit 3 [Mariprofundaceae bacterium]|nr:cytochrome c oxidase subunit 3 [Mariprofundaceae bacterium]
MSEIKHYTAHWHTCPYPLMVGFGAGLFLPWAFMLQFNYEQGLAAIVTLVVGLLLLVVGGLGWAGQTIGIVNDEGWAPSAMLMFIGTEVMTIGGVMASYWVLRAQAPIWPPEGVTPVDAPLMMTIFLLASSLVIGFARKQGLAGNAKGFANFTIVTLVMWVVFGYSMITDWGHAASLGNVLGDDATAYATTLYGFTGIHFAHIIFGAMIMMTGIPSALKGRYSDSFGRAMTMYVHFVNILGIWVLLQVYYW